MKMSGGLSEDGVVVGNTYDKYGSRNPVVRRIMHGFEVSLMNLVELAAPESIHEVGCGEGFWVMRWNKQGLRARGSDFSGTIVEIANDNASSQGLPSGLFRTCSIYDLNPSEDSADLIVCCEVLEHLERPLDALGVLSSLGCRRAIFSVPREPLWSTLNMVRGKYLRNWGNTPGHIQRWSKKGFVDLVSRHFDVIEICTPTPWTMLLCAPRASAG